MMSVRFIAVLVLLFLVLIGGAASYEKVPAGNVGVLVHLLGSSKGVDVETKGVGRYFLTINEEMFLFPTYTQNWVWTADNRKGSEANESFSFQTDQGLTVNADIGISYRINPSKASNVFQKYRKGVDEITDIYLRNMVQDSLNRNAGKLPIESVYGAGKTELLNSVQADVTSQVNDIGIEIEKLYWIGEIRLPDAVTQALNAKIGAIQKAQQRENEVAQAKAEADKEVEKARGDAESKLLVAEAEAKAIKIKGEALRENKNLVELTLAERWDGKLPTVTGGNTPLLDFRNMSRQ